MMDAINEVIDLLNDRSESEGNSRSESSSISSKQNDSSYKCLENEEESKSIITKNDSNHTIRPSTTNRNSDFDSKSEWQLACPSLILEEIKEPCFSYKKNEKERENPHSPKEESREEVDESSENYVDQYFRRLQGENLKKNLDESQSQDDKKFEQSQLERDLNNLSISTSQKVWDTDDKSEYLQKLDYILDNNGSNKLTEKLNEMTVKHQVSKIKGIDYENFEVNKGKV